MTILSVVPRVNNRHNEQSQDSKEVVRYTDLLSSHNQWQQSIDH